MAIPTPPSHLEILTLTAPCFCAFFRTTYTIPASSTPLKASSCHCTTCRKTSGHLFATFAVVPSTHRPDVSALTAYASSDALTRYFCPRCGASIANFEAHEWEFTTGVLARTGGGLLNRVQLWLEDTRDGGAGLWLNDSHSEIHIRDRTSQNLRFKDLEKMSEESRSEIMGSGTKQHQADDVLHASCHCGAVTFQVTRPDSGSSGSTSTKYAAGLDACTSCRTVTGFEITSWAFVPRNRIRSSNDQQTLLDLLEMPALSYYKTSPGVTRAFCTICGANIFAYIHRGNTGKEDTIDIAAGLLESPAGVRAEDWLEWDHYGEDIVAYREDAIDREFVEGLASGIKADGRA